MYTLTDTISNLRKLCDIIYTTTGLDVALFNAQYESILYLSHTHYPFLSHKIYDTYQQEVLDKLGNLNYSTCYVHPVPEAAFIYYDIRIQITDDLAFYACIGPVLSEVYSESLVLSIMSQLEMPLSNKETLFSFYRSLPYLSKQTSNALWLSYHLLTTMPDTSLIPVITFSTFEDTSKDSISASISEHFNTNLFLSPSEIQTNYEHEIQWRTAISQGNLKAAKQHLGRLLGYNFSYRNPTHPLRTKKNILFSLNTLCRAAAIDGGADSIRVHQTHELYLMRIEKAKTVSEINSIENSLPAAYCQLVLESHTKNLSPIVAKAVHYLYAHYDEPLSLQYVAKEIHCSEGHLSRSFQGETGKTLRTYLNELRVKQAIALLSVSQQSISDIALTVGFSSYNKFSIEFKKYTGKSATEYIKEAETCM